MKSLHTTSAPLTLTGDQSQELFQPGVYPFIQSIKIPVNFTSEALDVPSRIKKSDTISKALVTLYIRKRSYLSKFQIMIRFTSSNISNSYRNILRDYQILVISHINVVGINMCVHHAYTHIYASSSIW